MPGTTYTLELDSHGLLQKLQEAKGSFAGFDGVVRSSSGIGGFASKLAGMVAGLGAVGIAAAGLKRSISEAANMEDFLTTFRVLLGSSKGAKELAAGLNDLGAQTHLSMDQLAKASAELLSFGVAGEDVLRNVRTLSEVSGGNAEHFAALALAFSQTASAGKLMGQDLLQYIDAGFNPLQEISVRTGKGMGDLRKEMEAGNITFAQVADAFDTATSAGGRFYGFTEAKARTWNGQMAMLQNRIGVLFREFGQPFTDQLKPFLESAVGLASNLAGTAKAWGKEASDAIGTMRGLYESGELGQALKLSLQYGFAEGVNYGAALGKALATTWGIAVGVSLKNGMELLQAASTPGFWIGMANALAGVAGGFLAVMEEGVAGLLDALSEAPGFGFAKDAANFVREDAAYNKAESAKARTNAGDLLSPLWEKFIANVTTGIDQAGDAFKKNFSDVPQVLDANGFRAALQKLVTDALGKMPKPSKAEEKEDPKRQAPANANALSSMPEKVKPVTDSLARVGLFVGGPGGPAGNRYAQETAKNTGEQITYSKMIVDWQKQIHAGLKKQISLFGKFAG